MILVKGYHGFFRHPFLSINLDALKNGVLSVDNSGHDLLHRYDDEIKIIQESQVH